MSPANPSLTKLGFSLLDAPAVEAPVEVAPITADEIRHKILEQFTAFSPHLSAYHEYAQRVAALSLQYHNSRLTDVLGLPVEEEILLTTLDCRETPKSLDEKLSQLEKVPDTKIKRIVFDRVKGQYYLFI